MLLRGLVSDLVVLVGEAAIGGGVGLLGAAWQGDWGRWLGARRPWPRGLGVWWRGGLGLGCLFVVGRWVVVLVPSWLSNFGNPVASIALLPSSLKLESINAWHLLF